MDKVSAGKRIVEALEKRNIKQYELADATGIPRPTLSQYISGKYEPKPNNVALIAKYLDVSDAWLMGYDVQMQRDNYETIVFLKDIADSLADGTSQIKQSTIDAFNNLSLDSETIHMLLSFQSLSTEYKQFFQGFMDLLSNGFDKISIEDFRVIMDILFAIFDDMQNLKSFLSYYFSDDEVQILYDYADLKPQDKQYAQSTIKLLQEANKKEGGK